MASTAPLEPAGPGGLRRQLELTGDACLQSLIAEVTASGVLSFISTVTAFGTPHDITLQELAIESFFPADEFTARELARMAAMVPSQEP